MSKAKHRRFDVIITEVIVHRATITAETLHEANERAREMWDEDGPEAFIADTLGRTDLIIADEVLP